MYSCIFKTDTQIKAKLMKLIRRNIIILEKKNKKALFTFNIKVSFVLDGALYQ